MKEIDKILFVGSKSKYNSPYQNWYLVLKNLCKEIVSFDPHWIRVCNGDEYMNEDFFRVLEKEKPSLIFFFGGLNEFELNTFIKIKEDFSNIKTFIPLSDEDVRFESYSRFILLFIDYGLVFEKWFENNFKKDNTPGIYHLEGINTSFFKPIKLKKIYDVCFIGKPLSEKSQRFYFINYLKNKGINISLFGLGWEKYPSLKKIYGGPLESEEMIKIINQSKISLCFSRGSDGNLHENYRFFEAGSCNVFVLTEFFKGYFQKFKEGIDIITFKDKEELLNKINYFIKNEKKRGKIAKNVYKKIIKNYSLEKNLRNIIKKVSLRDESFKKELPRINKKTIYLSEKDLKLDIEQLKEKVDTFDYVGFSEKFAINYNYKEYLQQYSLLKTEKDICFCDYFVSRPFLKKYLYFDSQNAFKKLNAEDFREFLNKSQIMITKRFFSENISLFKEKNFEKIIPLGKENLSFVSIPLMEIKKSPKGKSKKIIEFFEMDFIYFLYAMKYNRNIFRKGHLFGIFLEILNGRFFIIKAIFDALRNRDRQKQLKIYETS